MCSATGRSVLIDKPLQPEILRHSSRLRNTILIRVTSSESPFVRQSSCLSLAGATVFLRLIQLTSRHHGCRTLHHRQARIPQEAMRLVSRALDSLASIGLLSSLPMDSD